MDHNDGGADAGQVFAAPSTLDEYNVLMMTNLAYEGTGLETAVVMPCPFCAAPGWFRMLVLEADLGGEATCGNCGRSAAMVVSRDGGYTSMELVQTGGDDPPAWMLPMPRRVYRAFLPERRPVEGADS